MPAPWAGVSVEVISGSEEARLIHLGVLQSVPATDQTMVIVEQSINIALQVSDRAILRAIHFYNDDQRVVDVSYRVDECPGGGVHFIGRHHPEVREAINAVADERSHEFDDRVARGGGA